MYQTFEEVNAHIESADLSHFEVGGKHHFASTQTIADPATTLSKVCAIYKVVAPVLKLVAGLPLIPEKWKKSLKILIDTLDTLCP